MLVDLLIAAGVVLFPLPALYLGVRSLLKRPGSARTSRPTGRPTSCSSRCAHSICLVVFALSAVILVSTIGALIQDVELHGLVYVFFALDVLLALLIVLSFGRIERRPARRRATPASR